MTLHDFSRLITESRLIPVRPLENGDTLAVNYRVTLDDWTPSMVRAIFIAPTQKWGQHRAQELLYLPDEVMFVSFRKDIRRFFDGRTPDDEGEPIIYLSGISSFFEGLVDTPEKRELRNLILWLKHRQFEVVDLDELEIGTE